jgi:type I restriction enzyme S subunit
VLRAADVVAKTILYAYVGQNGNQVAMELNEVCDLIIDCEHKTAPTQETGFPSIRTPNIGRGRFILEGVNRVSEQTYQLWTRRAVPQPGDLIMAREAPVGNVGMIPEGLRPCLGQRTLLIRPNRTKVDPSFLNYFLNGPHVQGLIHAKTNGATVAHLNMKDVRTMTLPELPPLPTQRRIAAILSAYDDLIENSQRRIRILESMARALYREWFVHFRFPGHETVKRVASPLGKIPEGWEVKKLADFVTTKYGYTESTNVDPVGPKYLRGMDINKTSFIDWSEVPYCQISPEDHEAYRLRVGDVVVIRMADPGKVGIVEQEVDAVFASYLIRVAPKDSRLSPYFLFFLMESAEYYAFITGASTGTTRKSASAGVIAEYQFVLPPQLLVEQFERRVGEIRSLLTTLLKKTVNLRRTRDLLLPRLLSGQVNLKEN